MFLFPLLFELVTSMAAQGADTLLAHSCERNLLTIHIFITENDNLTIVKSLICAIVILKYSYDLSYPIYR